MPSLIRAFSARKVLTERKCKAAAETDSRDEGGPRSGGRVLTFIKSPIFESFSTCSDEAGLLCWNPARHAMSFGLRYWNSDNKRTLPPLTRSPSRFSGEAMLRCTSNRHSATGTPYYTVRRTGYFLFHDTSNTELTTGSGFCPESLERVSDARLKKEP